MTTDRVDWGSAQPTGFGWSSWPRREQRDAAPRSASVCTPCPRGLIRRSRVQPSTPHITSGRQVAEPFDDVLNNCYPRAITIEYNGRWPGQPADRDHPLIDGVNLRKLIGAPEVREAPPSDPPPCHLPRVDVDVPTCVGGPPAGGLIAPGDRDGTQLELWADRAQRPQRWGAWLAAAWCTHGA